MKIQRLREKTINMNKGPFVDNKAYDFYMPFLPFNNPNITAISFKKKFLNFVEYHHHLQEKKKQQQQQQQEQHKSDDEKEQQIGFGLFSDVKNTQFFSRCTKATTNSDNNCDKNKTDEKNTESLTTTTTTTDETDLNIHNNKFEELQLQNIYIDITKMNLSLWKKLQETNCKNILITGNFGDNLMSPLSMQMPHQMYRITKCERLFINTTSDSINNSRVPGLDWINLTFPNLIELYTNTTSLKKCTNLTNFKNLKRFTCFTLDLKWFFEYVTFNEIYEMNIYYTNIVDSIKAPSYIKNVQVLRIPNNVILPLDFMINYNSDDAAASSEQQAEQQRILQYISRLPNINNTSQKEMQIPNINTLNSEFKSILFPLQNSGDRLIDNGDYMTGIYIFDPRLNDAIVKLHKDRSLYIHSVRLCVMTVIHYTNLNTYLEPSLEKLKLFKHSNDAAAVKIAISNNDIFKDHFEFNYWDQYIFKNVDFVILQKTIHTDPNGLYLSTSETYKIIYDLQHNILVLITSTVQVDYLMNHLVIINNKLKIAQKPKKIIVTKGFAFDINIQNTINTKMNEEIQFYSDAIYFDNIL